MPELPEVEFARRQLESALAAEVLARVEVADDPQVLEGEAPATIVAALRGARVEAVHRHGKHVWLQLDRRPWPLLHLGMTGGVFVDGEVGLQLQSGPRVGDAWPPKFTKLLLETGSGRRVCLTNTRRLGRIRLRQDPAREAPVADLGWDPLLEPPGPKALARALAGRRGALKGLLLNQRVVAGVGNWVADEVLFAAALDPRRPACSLGDAEVRALSGALESIVARAVAADADSACFPREWLFHQRWSRARHARTAHGDAIEWTSVAGRTTVWVPAVQREKA